jgi:hypothetical protein
MYEGYAATAILDGGIAATIGGSVSLTSKIIAGAVGGFSGGLASSGGDLKAAFQGALTGGAFGYVGTFSNPLANYAGHALVGCASGAMNGGGGEGCARGAVSQVISKWVTNNTAGRNWHPAAHFAVATISGGTMSVITGGKFATGAQTAAFGYLFNCLQHDCGSPESNSQGLSDTAADRVVGSGLKLRLIYCLVPVPRSASWSGVAGSPVGDWLRLTSFQAPERESRLVAEQSGLLQGHLTA